MCRLLHGRAPGILELRCSSLLLSRCLLHVRVSLRLSIHSHFVGLTGVCIIRLLHDNLVEVASLAEDAGPLGANVGVMLDRVVV